jgi:hypothetical protein
MPNTLTFMSSTLTVPAPTTPAAPVSSSTLIAEGVASPDSLRGAGARVRIQALDNGVHGECIVTLTLFEARRAFTLLPFDNDNDNTAQLALRACDVEVVSEALSRAVAVAKQAGIVPSVPGIPDRPEDRWVPSPEYLAAHPGLEEWLAGNVPEEDIPPIASRVTK